MKIKAFFYRTLFSFIYLSLFLSACSSGEISGRNNRVYGIDKSFRDFYKQMGGSEVLGPVISEVFSWEENQCQYTENALMCFNQNLSQNQGYFFFPIGAMLGVNSSLNGNNSDAVQEVYEEFTPLYQQLGGEPITGKLITLCSIQPAGKKDRAIL